MSSESQVLLVHAYLDGELDAANTLAVRGQIAQNARLAAELEGALALQATLRRQFPSEPVPAALRYRIDRALGKTQRWARPSWAGLAASVLIAISFTGTSTWLTLRPQQGDHLLGEIVGSHMRSLIASKPTEVTASDRHVVKPWFNGRIVQSPRVIDLKAEGFPLIGARIDVIGKTPVPTLVYTRRFHTISLVALPATEAMQATRPTQMDSGYNIARWSDGSTSYVATSDLNAEELGTFARLFRAAP